MAGLDLQDSDRQIKQPTGAQEGGDIAMGQKKFEQLEWIAKENPRLQETLRLMKGYIIAIILNDPDKEVFLREELGNPSAYNTNIDLYKSLFEFIQPQFNDEELKNLKIQSKEIYRQYGIYRSSATQRKEDIARGKKAWVDWMVTTADNLRKEVEWKTQKIKDLENAVSQASEALPPKWKSGMGKFVGESQNNQKLISDAARMRPDLGLPREWESPVGKEVQIQNYLRAIYISEHQWEIRKDIEKLEKEAPENEKQKYRDQLKSFDTGILSLNALNFPRPVKSLGPEMDGNFPPTRPAETARVQAEKYEKTHDVYRDGTSLYFVNKSNPRDTKRIDIYADRAVLTVSNGWLSVSKDMTLLSREETDTRKELRKQWKEYEESQRNTSTGQEAFFGLRWREYQRVLHGKNIYTSVFLRDHKEKQGDYDTLEKSLWSLPSTDKVVAINTMMRLSEEMRDTNRWFFDVSKFWDEWALAEFTAVTSMLEERISGLREFRTIAEKEAKIATSVADLTGKTRNLWTTENAWEKRAQGLLRELTGPQYWYHMLGQEYFDALIEGLRKSDPNWLWKDGLILSEDTATQRRQLDELRSFSWVITQRYANTWEPGLAWQNIRKEIGKNGSTLNKIWNSPNPNSIMDWIEPMKTKQSDAT